jgi:hypothetical protein
MYGRWEGRVRAPPSDETYNALLLLWPDAEDWPVGGEVDFMEMLDPTRQKTKFFLHYSEDDLKIEGEVLTDATQWRNWPSSGRRSTSSPTSTARSGSAPSRSTPCPRARCT